MGTPPIFIACSPRSRIYSRVASCRSLPSHDGNTAASTSYTSARNVRRSFLLIASGSDRLQLTKNIFHLDLKKGVIAREMSKGDDTACESTHWETWTYDLVFLVVTVALSRAASSMVVAINNKRGRPKSPTNAHGNDVYCWTGHCPYAESVKGHNAVKHGLGDLQARMCTIITVKGHCKI